MLHFNKYLFHIFTSLVLVAVFILMAGCNQKNETTVTTTQYTSYSEDEDTTYEDDDTTTSTATTINKTESVKKDWKQAYTDFVYELEDSYSGNIVYYLCPDFTGDGITDFICDLCKNDYESEKQIAVAYYNGGVSTLTSDVGFLGFDSENKLIGQSTESDGSWSIDNDRVKYYKFSNGEFVYAKTDKYGYYLADHTSISGYLKYEMLNEIKKGNSQGFII